MPEELWFYFSTKDNQLQQVSPKDADLVKKVLILVDGNIETEYYVIEGEA